MTDKSDIEAFIRRALSDAYRHGEQHAPFPMDDCARQIARRLQPARVPDGG